MKNRNVIMLYILLAGIILFQIIGVPAVVHEILDLQKNQIIRIVD